MLKIGPDDNEEEAYKMQSIILIDLSRYEEAISKIDKYLSKFQENKAKLYVYKSESYYHLKDFETSSKFLDIAISL